jgi:hypothetical protein
VGIKKLLNIYEKIPDFLNWISGDDVATEENSELCIGPHDEEKTPEITLDKVTDLYKFVSNGGDCIINPFANSHKEFISHALKRYLGLEKNSMNLDDLSNGQIIEQYNLKLCDHLCVGEYTDVIATDAYVQEHNFVRVRNYLLKCMSYFSYLNKGDIAFIPIDIEYGFSKDQFYVQVHANVQNFLREYLLSSFKSPDREYPFQSLLKDAFYETDFMEIVYLESAGKIIISSVWYKELGLDDFWPTLILNNIQSYEEKKAELAKKVKIKIAKITINLPSSELPGKSAKMKGGVSESQESLVKIKHIVEVIQRFRVTQDDEARIPLKELSGEELDIYEEQFENEIIKELDPEQRSYIIECLGSPNEFNNVEKAIDQILTPFDASVYADHFSDNIENLTTNEVNGYVNSELEAEEEANYIEDDGWKEKKSEIVKKIRRQNEEQSRESTGRVEMNSSFINIISTGLETSPRKVKPMVNDLGNKSIESMVKRKAEDGENSSDNFELKLEKQDQKFKNMLESANEKNIKYKKIIDMMKGQISVMADAENKIKAAAAAAKERGEMLNEKLQIDALKLELKNALTEVKNRESTIDKIRQSTDKVIKLKDKEITKLRTKNPTNAAVLASNDEKVPFKNSQLKVEEEIGGDEKTNEIILEIKEENNILNHQNEVLQKRLAQLNENMEKGTHEAINRAEVQINKQKENNSQQGKLLQGSRIEKDKYMRMYKVKEKEYSQLQEEYHLLKMNITKRESIHKKDAIKNNEQVTSSDVTDRAVADKMKAAKTKMKAYEQKIKFLNAQLDAANKKNGGTAATTKFTKSDGATSLKLRQLETLKIKAEDSLAKSLKDVIAAKKETHVLKQELMTAKNKIAEFERKLGKKAA